ncbi:unnamed protein product [Sphagnum troendelagicum]
MPVSIGIDQAADAMTGNARSSPLRQLLAEPLMKNNVVAIVNSYAGVRPTEVMLFDQRTESVADVEGRLLVNPLLRFKNRIFAIWHS